LFVHERPVKAIAGPRHHLPVLLVRDDADAGEGALVGLCAVPMIQCQCEFTIQRTGWFVSVWMSARIAAEAPGVPFVSNTSTPSLDRIAIALPSRPTSP